MPDDESPIDNLSIFTDDLQTRIEDVLHRALEICDMAEGHEHLQVLYEVWARQMGTIDAMACLRGVLQESRQKSLRNCFQSAKHAVLETHREECAGCETSNRLQAELEVLN